MAPAVAAAISALRAALEETFAARLREMVLFGSQARGSASEQSDVDVLVVVDGLTDRERVRIFDLAYDVGAASAEWVSLSPLPYSTEQAAELRGREKLLFRDIEREGIAV